MLDSHIWCITKMEGATDLEDISETMDDFFKVSEPVEEEYRKHLIAFMKDPKEEMSTIIRFPAAKRRMFADLSVSEVNMCIDQNWEVKRKETKSGEDRKAPLPKLNMKVRTVLEEEAGNEIVRPLNCGEIKERILKRYPLVTEEELLGDSVNRTVGIYCNLKGDPIKMKYVSRGKDQSKKERSPKNSFVYVWGIYSKEDFNAYFENPSLGIYNSSGLYY